MPTKEQIAAALPKHVAKFEKELTAQIAQYHEFFGEVAPLFTLFAKNPGRNVSGITLEVKEDHLKFRVVWAGEGFDHVLYYPNTETKWFAAVRLNHIIFKTDKVHHKASVRFRKLVVDDQS